MQSAVRQVPSGPRPIREETTSRCGDAIALHQPMGSKAAKAYRTVSWQQWLAASSEIALGLRALGLCKGEVVCILSETRAEFYVVDLGVMAAGGVAAALTPPIQSRIKCATLFPPGPVFYLWKILRRWRR